MNGTDSLLERFQLQDYYTKLLNTALPSNYTHFIQELRMPMDAIIQAGELENIVKCHSFERPIELLNESILKKAFFLRPNTKHIAVEMKMDQQHVTILPDMKADAKMEETEEGESCKRDKKEKKKRVCSYCKKEYKRRLMGRILCL